jgi:hypothetical protein
LEATRLGIAKLMSSMSGLTAATKDNGLLKDTYDFALGLHHTLNSSLGSLIGGTLIEPNGPTGHPDVEEQRNAIRYALGEGAQSLDVLLDADLVARSYPVGALRRISEARARIVTTLLNAPRLAAIEDQARSVNYSLFDYADDVTDAIWSDLSAVPLWRRDLQQAYLRAAGDLLRPVDAAAQKSAKDKLRAAGYSENYVLLSVSAGSDTAFPAWAGEALPRLRSRLETAMTGIQDRPTRLHLKHAAAHLGALLESAIIAQSGSTAVRAKANAGSASVTSP